MGPHLYLGSLTTAKNKKLLRDYDITHIIAVYGSFRKKNNSEIVYFPITNLQDCGRRYHIDLFYSYIPQINTFIHNTLIKRKPGNILVHCIAGASRSVTIIALYLLTLTTSGTKEILEWIKVRRQLADPNEGFRKLLKDYENSELCKAERIRLGILAPLDIDFFGTRSPVEIETIVVDIQVQINDTHPRSIFSIPKQGTTTKHITHIKKSKSVHKAARKSTNHHKFLSDHEKKIDKYYVNRKTQLQVFCLSDITNENADNLQLQTVTLDSKKEPRSLEERHLKFMLGL